MNNEFTKEELEYIYDELDSNYSELKNITLMKKVKSMIDNYCEHINDIRFNAYPIDGSPKMCTECHGFYI